MKYDAAVLERVAQKFLSEGKTLKAKLGGPGMKGTVKLKPFS